MVFSMPLKLFWYSFRLYRALEKIRERDQIDLNRKVTKGNYWFSSAYSDNMAVSEGLKKLSQFMADAAEEMGTFKSLEEYNDTNGKHGGRGTIPYQIVIVDNFPNGFDDDDIQKLDRLVLNGGERGIFVILMNNRDEWQEMERKDSLRQGQTVYDKLTAKAADALEILTLKKRQQSWK